MGRARVPSADSVDHHGESIAREPRIRHCSPRLVRVPQATANHYLLDAVGGFFVTVVAYKINHLLLYLRPLEEWGMWLCR
jgi:hypothetical protein